MIWINGINALPTGHGRRWGEEKPGETQREVKGMMGEGLYRTSPQGKKGVKVLKDAIIALLFHPISDMV